MEVLIFHGLRNGLCVVRDLLSPTSYWLSDLGFPISATGIIPEVAISSTPIDVVIGILQLLVRLHGVMAILWLCVRSICKSEALIFCGMYFELH